MAIALSFPPLLAAAPGEAFAADLCARWCDGSQNVVFSPYSLSAALAMTAAGARGESAAQIARALRLADSPAKLPEACAAIESALAEARAASPGLTLAVANSLWPQQGFPIRDEFADLIRTRFKGAIAPLDYVVRTEEARQTINRWVEERTAARIKDLIPAGVLGPTTRLTLVNAIYFLGSWSKPFDASLTATAPFQGPRGAASPAAFMHRKGEMRYAETDGAQVLELPYAGERFAMLLLLPGKENTVGAVTAQWRAQGAASWDTSLRPREVSLFLPRFACTWMADCGDTLAKIGIADIFDASRADLSGMAGKAGDLAVSAVLHKAFVEVTEQGTEAAAATAGVIGLTAFRPPKPPVIFRADRPFFFLIRERQSGCILFAGVVARP